jgi:hypothetical protein
LPYKGGPVSDAEFTVPSTVAAAAYVGHGVVVGALDPARFDLEQLRFLDALRGRSAPPVRPAGEKEWMTADSKIRQALWGSWSEGYYTGP